LVYLAEHGGLAGRSNEVSKVIYRIKLSFATNVTLSPQRAFSLRGLKGGDKVIPINRDAEKRTRWQDKLIPPFGHIHHSD